MKEAVNNAPHQAPRLVVERWIMTFNSADADALAILYCKDATATLPGEPPARGRNAIRRMYAARFRRVRTFRAAETILGTGDVLILEWCELDGEVGHDFFTVRDGLIVSSGLQSAAPRARRFPILPLWVPRRGSR